jgi:hypothetical protein
MQATITGKSYYSSHFITLLANVGISVLDSIALEPSITIVSDIGNGTVSQNAYNIN